VEKEDCSYVGQCQLSQGCASERTDEDTEVASVVHGSLPFSDGTGGDGVQLHKKP
jgi:hypothetical protein